MRDYSYIPILKTTDAELKAYSFLADSAKDQTMPLFELTKARRTKSDRFGNIHKRMQKLASLTDGRRFILDLTIKQDLSNYQIEDLLDPDNGFENWIDFLSNYQDLDIVPMVHIDPEDLLQTAALVKKLKSYPLIALKIEHFDSEIDTYLKVMTAEMTASQSALVIIDAEYITHSDYREAVTQIKERVKQANAFKDKIELAVSSSSFPKSVPNHTSNCHDHEGDFAKLEPTLFDDVNASTELDLVYADYASVHPIRYDTGGGTWVPRVDFPLWGRYIYTRYRRKDGGYIRAAKAMLSHPKYKRLECWGCDEIEAAAASSPNGLSPSYWISVRANIHMTRHALGIR